jgi:uncharacterized protein
MELSRFVVTYRDVRPGEHVLYDVLSDRYAGVDSAALEAVARWSGGDGPSSPEEEQAAEALYAQGVLVAGRDEDDARLRAHLEAASEGEPGEMRVTLMPTLACNIACTYCFQKDSPAFTKMSDEDRDLALEWILRRVDERALRVLHVHYFGGEPLTRKAFVLHTAEVLHESMRARGGRFDWSMTTNGIGLDVPFAQAMRRFGQGSIKVTLDGDRETHDRTRVRRDGSGTFDEIFANVAAVAPYLRVRIGGNFTPDQVASFERLLERLDAEGVTPLLEAVRFKPVIDVSRSANSTCSTCADGKQEVQALVQLNRSIEKRRLGPHAGETLESMLGPCELHWKNSYVIDPKGLVYKCPAVAGRPEMAVASVRGESEKVAPLVALRPWEQCGDCPYLPVCVGGCLGGKYLQTGRTDQVACKKESFEASFRRSVISRYLAEFPDAGG